MKIKDLFESDITRDIPPVVYFREQTPAKLADEVKEYIVTGGWPVGHPNHNRVPNGIHEQYVSLLSAIASELDKAGGPELPTAWISGFYGSGKSSFAKLLGLALDGKQLPDGTSLAEAWLKRDTSPRAVELRDAWTRLRAKVEPIAVVFDIGAIARDNEHIHAAVVRQVQKRLGYCSTDALVADAELKLERDKEWKRFEQVAEQTLKKPWSAVKDTAFADDDFSTVMHAMFPERYDEPTSWFTSRAGLHRGAGSPDDAVAAISDMLDHRSKGKTLFIVVDEVSQYILSNEDRVLRLTSFVENLGAVLKGKAWLMALGQQKIDEQADDSFLIRAKDRFPPKLRVHLSPTNIRDVVHKRLLSKKPAHEASLRASFEKHRADLKLFAYGCGEISAEDFVEVYPLLPGYIDLLLQITTALRARSTRAQGDDQAIRGLLQLLGELFRDQQLADGDIGTLITFDKIYEVQHTALDSDAQNSMSRILEACAHDKNGLMVRAAKAVALLELVNETLPTTPQLVAQVLYDRLDRGSNVREVTEALEELRRRNLLGYSEKQGYALQSSAGEEWESERRDLPIAREAVGDEVLTALKVLLGGPTQPRLDGRSFPFEAVFSDGRRADNAVVLGSRDEATLKIDFRMVRDEPKSNGDDQRDSVWVKRSAESAFKNLIVWVSGDTVALDEQAKELLRSKTMVAKYAPRRESMTAAKKILLQREDNRARELEDTLKNYVGATWLSGKFYFRGEAIDPKVFGSSFGLALQGVANKKLPDIYSSFVSTTVLPSELLQLLGDISAPPPKFLKGELGVLELDGGKFVPTCTGAVPTRIHDAIFEADGMSGAALLTTFGSAPYGHHVNVVKAAVLGLVRAGKVKISPETGDEITSRRDAGAKDLFEKDRSFKRAIIYPIKNEVVTVQDRARVCKFFEEKLGQSLDRENDPIADAVQHHFPTLAQQTRDVMQRLSRLPDHLPPPESLVKLHDALEACLRHVRQTQPTVVAVKKHLDVLRDGVQVVKAYSAELTDDVLTRLSVLAQVRDHQCSQLADVGGIDDNVRAACAALQEHIGRERPWSELSKAEGFADVVRSAYKAERTRLLARQEELANTVRARVKIKPGFSTLGADQAHHVLRPIAEAQTDTTAEAVAPSLAKLKDAFDARLYGAEDEAIARLDALQAQKPTGAVQVVKLDLNLKHREVSSVEEVEALLQELRERLLAQLKPGTRVRLGS